MSFLTVIASTVVERVTAGQMEAELDKAERSVEPGRKVLNSNTRWLRDAKWGFFAHYLAHMPSAAVPEDMNAERWNAKVNSFQVKRLADQLSSIRVPYFFITIGQGGDYFCSPNKSYERQFGPSGGKLSDRDLITELAEELTARGIRMCVYLPAVGYNDSIDTQRKWQQVIAEWSLRWGKSISAWWIDGAVFADPDMYDAYTDAFKAGNPDALIAYNTGPIGMTRDLKQPATESEDYLAGEVNWHLPVSGVRPWDEKEYYMGPDIAGDQLHFLTFLGTFWGAGDPRFPVELVIGWTKHINNHGGTISWDVPLSDSGIIPEKHMVQLRALSKSIGR